MEIIAKDISKIYDYSRIIVDFNFHFKSDSCYGISGANGSGKSTLIKILSGFLSPSTGSIQYLDHGKNIHQNSFYHYVSIAAPYSSPILDFDLKENFELIKKFKNDNTKDYIHLLEMLEWKDPKQKLLRYFSSGMLQRVSVCMALMFTNKVILLDEPTSFLDEKSKEWFKKIVEMNKNDKLIIIASNDASDFYHCGEVVAVR